MTPVEFATYVRYKTKTTSTTLENDEILSYMKLRQDEIAKAILKADEDILLIPQKANLVASTLENREYPVPQDILSRLKRVEAQLNGTDWIPLTEIDTGEIRSPISSEDDITDIFNNYQISKSNANGARFDILRKSIYIYSGTITATTNGLRMWCKTWPTAITDLTATADMSQDPSTTTHGIPRAMHGVWAKGVIIDYKESKEKPIPLSESELNYERNMKKSVRALRHGNLDREVIGHLPPASERGNDGFDY
jgi:hypothetical protein